MKVLQMNSVYQYGSTGRIMYQLHQSNLESGIESYVIYARENAFGREKKKIERDQCVFRINNELEMKEHLIKAVLLDKHGLYSKKNTLAIINKIREIKPDLIHLHNIHGFYLNYELFFDFLRKYDKPVVWTLHDCWSFTGYCSYYDYNECFAWQNGCRHCRFKNVYPYKIFNNAEANYIRKKNAFKVNRLTLVTPSDWLRGEVAKSFLKEYPCKVIHNSVDTSHFRYISDTGLRDKHGLQGKKILLAVASPFTKQKGFEEFLKLAEIISEEYRIVMIGLSEKQIKKLPKNIYGLQRTENVDELAKWYSEADVFINLTLEDNYPTVNLEAKACGLPIVSYRTGGSTEMVQGYGIVVEKYNIEQVWEALQNINLEKKPYTAEDTMSLEYQNLYRELTFR